MEVVLSIVAALLALLAGGVYFATERAERRSRQAWSELERNEGIGAYLGRIPVQRDYSIDRPTDAVGAGRRPTEGAAADTEARYHVVRHLIRERLRALPPNFGPDTLPTWRDALLSLASETASVPAISGYLEETANLLGEFRQSLAFERFFISPLLQRRFLDGYISGRVEDIRAWADVRESREGLGPFVDLVSAVEELVRFATSWASFREEAAKGLFWKGIGQAPDPQQYDELRHSISTNIVESAGRRELIWVSWQGMLSSPRVLERLASYLETFFEHMHWQFGTICTMSASILPLATLLAVKMKRELIASDSRTNSFLPRNPNLGERTLLIDTIVNSGDHLLKNQQNIIAAGAVVEAVFVLVLNDMYFSESKTRFDPIDYRKEYGIECVYLYKMSDLFKSRSEELLEGLQEDIRRTVR